MSSKDQAALVTLAAGKGQSFTLLAQSETYKESQ